MVTTPPGSGTPLTGEPLVRGNSTAATPTMRTAAMPGPALSDLNVAGGALTSDVVTRALSGRVLTEICGLLVGASVPWLVRTYSANPVIPFVMIVAAIKGLRSRKSPHR